MHRFASTLQRAGRFLVATRLRRWATGGVVFVALLSALLHFGGPPLVRHLVVSELASVLQRPVRLEAVELDFFGSAATLKGLEVADLTPDAAPLLAFDGLHVELALFSLLHGAPEIHALRLDTPQVHLVRLGANRTNISDLIDAFMARPEGPTPLFSLHQLAVQGGAVHLDDRVSGRKVVLDQIAFELPFVSSLPAAQAKVLEPAFSARLDGAPVRLAGTVLPFGDPLESALKVSLERLDLADYQAYLPPGLPFVVKAGQADVDLVLRVRRPAGKALELNLSGRTKLRGLDMRHPDGAPLGTLASLTLDLGAAQWADGRMSPLQVKDFALTGLKLPDEALLLDQLDGTDARIDLQKRTLSLKQLAIGPGQATVRRLKGGAVQWLALPAAKPEKASVAVAAQTASAVPVAAPVAAPWALQLDQLTLKDTRLVLDDQSLKVPARQSIWVESLLLEDLRSEAGTTAKLELKSRINPGDDRAKAPGGELNLRGTLQARPLALDVTLDARNLAILPWQPYFADRLTLVVKEGVLASEGRLRLAQNADGSWKGMVQGQLTLGDFRALDTLATSTDRRSGDFLRWKSLYLGGIDVQVSPLAVKLDEVALSEFSTRVVINNEGKINLANLMHKPGAPASTATPADPKEKLPTAPDTAAPGEAKAVLGPGGDAPFPLSIGKITLQGGSINFRDQFIKPNYSAQLSGIGGTVGWVSSAPESVATLDLRGSYENQAPISIAGSVRPFAARPTLDIKAEVRGVEMTTLSPYAAKYAGYAIEKGKLSLFVNYKLENQLLTAQNRIFLNQLTFGEPVESPDATKLPVLLAVALLKNSKGEIELNVPISGSLDDPQFSLGEVIAKAVGNLFVKVVTAPFTFLAKLFSGGEELSWLAFEHGRSTLDADAKRRLQGLAKALAERPALQLEIRGEVDLEDDREALKTVQLERKIRRQKLAELDAKTAASMDLDSVSIDPKEYPGLLEKVYRNEGFAKPRDILGLLKRLPVEEMEKLILANTQVSEDSLRSLANRRANRVRDWLLEEAKVPSERLFVLAPRLETDAADGKARKSSRVEFSLR